MPISSQSVILMTMHGLVLDMAPCYKCWHACLRLTNKSCFVQVPPSYCFALECTSYDDHSPSALARFLQRSLPMARSLAPKPELPVFLELQFPSHPSLAVVLAPTPGSIHSQIPPLWPALKLRLSVHLVCAARRASHRHLLPIRTSNQGVV